MMTTQTIALLGGVVVLLVLLLVVRRRRAKAETAPAAGRTAPDLSDLAAAAPPALAGPAGLYAAEGLAEAPAAPMPAAPAPEPALSQAWAEDEVVTEPGWLMPGEVDHAWQADFAAASRAPVAAGVGAGAHVNGNGNGNGAAHEVGHLIDAAAGGFDPAVGWGEETTGTLTVERPPDDEPAELADEAADEPRIPRWDPADAVAEAVVTEPAPVSAPQLDDLAMPAWDAPAVDGWSEDPVPADATPPAAEALVQDEPAAWPEPAVTGWEPPAGGWEPPAGGWEPLADEPVEAPAAAFEPAEDTPAGEPAEVVAWWDLPDPEQAPPEEAPAVAVDAGTGRFALGGFALQPGHEAIAGVTFRAPLASAPAAWAVGPVDEAAPGTIVLSVDGAVNCAPGDVAVLMEDGFAPSSEGFTVRAAARTAGPFAASGTFRVS